MNKTFQKNLKALSIRNPVLAQKLLTLDVPVFEFDQAASGDYNLIVNGIHIHNTEDPQLEAKLVFGEEHENDENDLKLIFGLGLGYLFKRAYISSKATIILFEPSLDILRATLDVVDFSLEISDPRVFVIADVDEIKQAFLTYYYEKVFIFHLDYYKNSFAELYQKAYLELNQYYVDLQTNIQNSQKMSNIFVDNLAYFIKYPSVSSLKDTFKDKQALVVCAGPSLDKAITIIKENRGKFIIISIGQALKALYKEGIIPDFVVIVDMLPLIHQVNFLGDQLKKINLVLQTPVSNDFFKLSTNTKFVYFPESDYISEWYVNRIDAFALPQGGSVGICAFNIAKLLGVKSIILIGQDLAYSEGKVYASNTIYDSVKYTVSPEGTFKAHLEDTDLENASYQNELLKKNIDGYEKIVHVKGWNGETLNTNNAYASFISQYELIARNIKTESPEITLINASVGGAYIEGFEHKPLEECISGYSDIEENINDLITNQYKANTLDEKQIKNLKQSFNKLLIDLKALKSEAEKVVKNSKRLLMELKRTKTLSNKVIEGIKKLQKQDSRIKKYNTKDRVSFIYPFIQKELFDHNRVKDRTSTNELEKARNLIHTIQNFSETMIIGTDKVISKFNEMNEDFLN